MKAKLMTFGLSFAIGWVLCGCLVQSPQPSISPDPSSVRRVGQFDGGYGIYEIKFEEHSYIAGRHMIIHSASCQCQKGPIK